MRFWITNIIFLVSFIGLLVINQQQPISVYIFILLVGVYVAIVTYGTLYISSQFFIQAKTKGSNDSQAIAITFDDGPVPKATEKILEIFQEHNAKATFFCIGKNISEHPELLQKIHNGGHLIGNHSYFHGAMFDMQLPSKMIEELQMTNSIIEKTIGKKPRFFRPPYGVTNPMVAAAIKNLKMLSVGWSVRSFDTVAEEKKKLLERVIKNLKGGDVILFHDRCEVTIQILPELLNHIKQKGLRVEPLDKLLNEPAYA